MPEKDIDNSIKTAEINFKKTVSEIQKSDDTFLNKSLLNLARSQNDYIHTLNQSKSKARQ